MNNNILRVSQLSPSTEAMKSSTTRGFQNGGATQDFSVNVENIREVSRKLNTNILPSVGPLRNLVKYSQEFDNPNWQTSNMSISANTITAPDGTLTAEAFMETAINSSHYITQIVPAIGGQMYTVSAYLKYNGRQWGYIGINTGSQDRATYFDIVNGVVGTSVGTSTNNARIENVGNGWFRCSVSMLSFSTANMSIASVLSDGDVATHLGDITKGYYIWGYQFELGSQLTPYQPTRYTQTNEELTKANFLYVPSIIAESKTYSQNQKLRNQWLLDSENIGPMISDGVVGKSLNVIANPINGLINADKLTEVSGQTACQIYRYYGTVPAQTYTFSVYLKPAERYNVQLAITSGVKCNFNLTAGTFSGLVNETGYGNFAVNQRASIENAGNGWYRCSISCTYNVVAAGFGISTVFPSILWFTSMNDAPTQMTDGYGMYVWGMQMEINPIPTTYQRVTDNLTDFTFTRNTTATVTNKLGVIEDSCYNLYQRSEEFDNALWAKSDSTISANQIVAPNGTLSADKLIENSNLSSHYIVQSNVITTISGNPITMSCYAKAGERTAFALYSIANGNSGARFNLSNGTVISNDTQVSSSTITPVGNGWYYCTNTTIPIVNSVGTSFIYLYNSGTGYQGDGISGIYIWGAQISYGSTPRQYLRTTNRLNVPRLDYSKTLAEPSLLIEPQRTNLFGRSEDFDLLTKEFATVSANTTTAPSGLLTADKIIEATGTTGHDVYLSGFALQPAGGNITWSCYLKPAERTKSQLFIGGDGGSNTIKANFDLISGTFINSSVSGDGNYISNSIKSVGNGWYRCSVTGNFTASRSPIPLVALLDNNGNNTYSGDGVSGLYAWGGQVEVGLNATSFIPTVGASITRNAETSYIDLSNNNMLNMSAFTLYAEVYLYDFQIGNVTIALSDTTGLGSNTNQLGYSRGFLATVYSGGTPFTIGSPAQPNTQYKLGIQYDGINAKYYRDGVLIGTIPVTPFNYQYLVVNNGLSTFSVDKLGLFNRTFTNAEMINLTTPTYNSFESLSSGYTYTTII